jgi:ABC-type uncharacterized transport system ATPase subunit
VLAVQGLTLPRPGCLRRGPADIGFEVRAGEIVGVAGVSGNGQQELMAALSGEDPRARRAAIACSAGHRPTPPRRARAEGEACTSCPRSAWAAAPCPR